MRAVIILLPILFLGGCSGMSVVPSPPIAPTPPGETVPVLPAVVHPKPDANGRVDPIAEAKADSQEYGELKAKYAALEKAADERADKLTKQASADSIRSQVNWITGICLLLAALCGVAVFIVPLGKQMLTSGAIGLTVVAACAQAFAWAVPYLPWIGGVLIVVGGLWAAFHGRKLGDAAKTAASHGDRLEDWIMNDLPGDARAAAAKIVADVKAETTNQATMLGVHSTLQGLRGKTKTLWQQIASKVA